MIEEPEILTKDKLLFTPGPLTTTETVKKAMLRDLGSRDTLFIETVKEIRSKLLELGEVSQKDGYEAVIMQGSGTFGIESVITSAIPQNGHLLIIVNGAYGERIVKMADIAGIQYNAVKYPENEGPNPQEIEGLLKNEPRITHIAIVHCETTTGIINPIEAIGKLAKKTGKKYIVDAMSSFGAVPINVKDCDIDYLVSSSNKCIQGVPGFSFVIAKRSTLESTEGYSRSLSLDLYAQWKGLETNGQFRFTPPTHALLAFAQALNELEEEGGVAARANRYRTNYETLVNGMRELGFKEYLEAAKQGYIITSFHYPGSTNFSFEQFYSLLNDKGFVIYPGKVSKADCFRIGNIGQIATADIQELLAAIQQALADMEVEL